MLLCELHLCPVAVVLLQIRRMFETDPSLGAFSKQVQAVVWSSPGRGVAPTFTCSRHSMCYLAADRLPPSLLNDISAAVKKVGSKQAAVVRILCA